MGMTISIKGQEYPYLGRKSASRIMLGGMVIEIPQVHSVYKHSSILFLTKQYKKKKKSNASLQLGANAIVEG